VSDCSRIFRGFYKLEKGFWGVGTTTRQVARGCEVIKGMCIEFSSVTRVGEKILGTPISSAFEKMAQKGITVTRGLEKLMSRVSSGIGAHNLLENEAGTQGWRGKQVILVVVQVQEAYVKRKDWGQQRSPQCIYMNKQQWCAPS